MSFLFSRLLRRSILLAGVLFAGSALAGSYTQNFSNATLNTWTIGDTSTLSSSTSSTTITRVVYWAPDNKALQLLGGIVGDSLAAWRIPDLDVGREIQSFDANFTVGVYRATASVIPGAGWSLNFGAIPSSGSGAGEGGFAMPNGLIIAYDIFNNGGADNPSIEIFCNGVSVGNFPSSALTDAPLCESGTFKLTNPNTGGTTSPIPFNANETQIQSAVRLVPGWEVAQVTGSVSDIWIFNRGVAGAYPDPVVNTSGLVPANSAVYVTPLTPLGDATHNERCSLSERAWRPRAMSIHWDANGLDISMNGIPVCTNLSTPGFVPAVGNTFAFSARNEHANTMDMFLDDVVLATTQLPRLETGGPVITEFVADNDSGLEDEDSDKSDWIEIYNGQDAAANLSGYRLTNTSGNNLLWTFPAMVVPAYGFKIVCASGKNRTSATGQLHTNFTLQKEGGYLALIKPDGTSKASEFNYGPQYKDISYGETGFGRTLGYLLLPSPGINAGSEQAPGGPAEDVIWSRDGGLISGVPPTAVTIAVPVAAGSVVRYTTNNSVPGSSSPIYNPASPPSAFTVGSTVTLRARVFTPNRLPGPVSSRTFLKIDSSLTDYNGSGQPFSTNLPIIVLDSFGIPVNSYTSPGEREYNFTYVVVIAPNPLTGRATITDPPDFQGRCGTHLRGETSATFPQRQYSWELWDNANNDKDASILGLPANSDWILYAPWNDKTLIREVLVFGAMRKLRSDYLAARTKYCEVLFNQTAGAPVGYAASYRGIYAVMEKLKIGRNRVDLARLNSLTNQSPGVSGGYIFRRDQPDTDSTVFSGGGGLGNILSYDPDVLNSAQKTWLESYIGGFEAVLTSGNYTNPATGYAAWIDVGTFIDAQWFVEWPRQVDGYVVSTYFHKDRNGRLRAGPIWDYDLSLGNPDYQAERSPTGWLYDTTGTASGTGQLWYPRLHTDPWYRLRHFDRYWEMRRGILATNTILSDIDGHAAALLNGSATTVTNSMASLPPTQENAAMRHYRLFPRLGEDPSRPTYQSEVSNMKSWLATRLAWLDDQNFTGSVIYRPLDFSSYGGIVDAGTQLVISRYIGTPPSGKAYATGGTIYFTTDGSDPRAGNAQPAAAAMAYSGPVVLNSSQTVRARLFTNNVWSPITTATYVIDAVPATAANLVVSEIMYDPPVASATESAAGYTTNDFEYLELQNVGTGNIDLTHCELTAGITFDFGSGNPSLLTVPPGGRVVVAGNPSAFAMRYGSNPAVKIAGPYNGNLSNGGERITLVAANDSIIADFSYGVDEPWPTDAHGGTGYSLVLNDPAPNLTSAYYNTGTNWRSSGTPNGTPGLPNGSAFSGSPGGDTDADGLSDYLEYSTGSNMSSAASHNLPVASVAAYTVNGVTDNYFKYEYRRNLSADGVHYTVQASTDLATWSSAPSAVVYVGTHNNGDGTATVTCRAATPMAPGHPKLFMRLSVTP